jgi:molybdenum-dependent DNA-binding transcriptional regulator ModE
MKIETAIGILNKEREFLGMGFLDLLQDIQKEGKMIYSERVMEAFERFMVDGRKMFAPVAE